MDHGVKHLDCGGIVITIALRWSTGGRYGMGAGSSLGFDRN